MDNENLKKAEQIAKDAQAKIDAASKETESVKKDTESKFPRM